MNLEEKLFKPDTKSKKPESEQQTELRIKNYFKSLYAEMHGQHPDMFEFVRRYKSDAYFTDVNNLKRAGKEKFKDILTKAGRPMEEIEERILESELIIDNVKVFLENSKLPENITVYRKISRRMLDEIKSAGGSFGDNGFVSTSFTLEDAKRQLKQFCVKIIIPAGTKVIDMTSALQFTNWQASSHWENELVIGDGYRYKVKPSNSDNVELVLEVDPSE